MMKTRTRVKVRERSDLLNYAPSAFQKTDGLTKMLGNKSLVEARLLMVD